ncbi:hypothetical protein [Pseudomonas sp. CCC2.2]
MLSRHGIDIPRQSLARWVIQRSEHLQPLLSADAQPAAGKSGHPSR